LPSKYGMFATILGELGGFQEVMDFLGAKMRK
jgi:hypothetical protein